MAYLRRNEPFAEAAKELEIYFASADATLGMHGTGFEGSGATVWDSVRIHAAHIQPRLTRHRLALEELAEITPTVISFRERAPDLWWLAAVTFTARRWPDPLGERLSRGARGGSLVAPVLLGRPLLDVWKKRETGRLEAKAKAEKREADAPHDPSALDLLGFLRAEADVQDAPRVHRFLEPLRRDAETRLETALKAYDGMVRQRRQDARRQAACAAGGP